MATVTNSTLSANRWGLYFAQGGAATLTNSTVGRNTTGLVFDRGGTATLANTLLAKEASPTCTFSEGGTLINVTHNLADDGTCLVDGVNGGRVVTTAALGLDPAGLASNGGPTQTIALLEGSAAIDAGDDMVCAQTGAGMVGNVDQRGNGRPHGAHCDSGAYEGGDPPPSPSVTLTVTPGGPGSGTVERSPDASDGAFTDPPGSVVTLIATPAAGSAFIGWSVDGTLVSWQPVVTVTADTNHSVVANFAPLPTFGDVPTEQPFTDAVQQLAARGIIKGCDATAMPPLFCPDEPTLRAQMAALIVRAMPGWADESWPNTFSDPIPDAELWDRVATLQHYQVAQGYQDAVCQEQGKGVPCFGPLDRVRFGQTLLFISRAMVEHGYWQLLPDDPAIFPELNGPTEREIADHRSIVTYLSYAGPPPDVAYAGGVAFQVAGVTQGGWGDPSGRGWFARALWQALSSYFGADQVP